MAHEPSIAVLGGCGHVGLPLALTFASRGCDVTIVDSDQAAVDSTNSGQAPFFERGAAQLLKRHIHENLRATTCEAALAQVEVVICVIGTPIDEHFRPDVGRIMRVMATIRPHLRGGQLFVLRSTVHPGFTEFLARWLGEQVPQVDLAYCPERVAQGHAIEEISILPQLVSGVTPDAARRARVLFSLVSPEIIEVSTLEAELGKLLCNSWRYITFAVANQFYALCAEQGVDYSRVRDAIMLNYPRLSGLPAAGFAAGPCLFKDTVQLAASCPDRFPLGREATLVNEGFPRILLDHLRPIGLADKTVGLLGMAFKAESDDIRDSLAYRMKDLLEPECRRVLCTDEYVRREHLVPLENVLNEADILVICAPHSRYAALSPHQPTLDPWNILGRGGLLR